MPVQLAPPQRERAAELFALVDADRTRLARWLPWVDATQGPDDSAAFLDAAARAEADGHSFTRLVEVDGRLAGVCDLHGICQLNRHAAIGYWLGHEHTGRGLMAQVLQQLLAQAFGPLALHRLVIDAAAANTRSCAVAERAGFRVEGVLREYLYLHGRYWDARQYSLLSHEWKSR